MGHDSQFKKPGLRKLKKYKLRAYKIKLEGKKKKSKQKGITIRKNKGIKGIKSEFQNDINCTIQLNIYIVDS